MSECKPSAARVKIGDKVVQVPTMIGSPFTVSNVEFYAEYFKIGMGAGDKLNWWPRRCVLGKLLIV